MDGTDRHARMALSRGVVAALVSVVAVVVVAGLVPVRHSSFARAAEEALRRLGADSVSVGVVSVALWRGVALRDVFIEQRIDAKWRASVDAPKVRVSYRLLRAVLMRKKCLEVLERRGAAARRCKRQGNHLLRTLYEGTAVFDSLLPACVSEARFSRVALRFTETGGSGVRCGGLRGTIRVAKNSPYHIRADVTSDHADLYGLAASKIRGTVRLEGPVLVVEKLRADFLGGKIREANATVDLVRERIAEAFLDARNVRLGKFYSGFGAQTGTLRGRADLSLRLESSALHPDSLRGTGTFKLSRMVVKDVPVLQIIANITDVESLRQLSFRRVRGDVEVREGRAWSSGVQGIGHPISISANGWTMLRSGHFDYAVSGLFGKEYADSVPAIVWNAMLPADDDGREFRIQTSGTFQDPSVRLDRAMTRRAVRSVLKSVGQQFGSMFRGKRRRDGPDE